MRYYFLLLFTSLSWSSQIELSPKEKSFLNERIIHVGLNNPQNVNEEASQALCKAYINVFADQLKLWIKFDENKEDLANQVNYGKVDIACLNQGPEGNQSFASFIESANHPKLGEIQTTIAVRPDWEDLISALKKGNTILSSEDKQKLENQISSIGENKWSRDTWGWIIISLGLILGISSYFIWNKLKKED